MAAGMPNVGLESGFASNPQPSSCLHLGKHIKFLYEHMSADLTVWHMFVDCAGENFDPKNMKNVDYEKIRKKKKPLGHNSHVLNK